MHKIVTISVVAALALWLAVAPALAATPQAFVKNILDEVMAIQSNPAMEGPSHETVRAQAIRRVIQKNFDFPYMAQDSLGAAYDRLNPGQRQEFATVFSCLFQASYTNMVLRFLKREEIKYGNETVTGNKARVDTTLMRANDHIQVEYLLHQKGGNWVLYDVIVDGVSILDKYKTGFAREIQTGSFDSLLNKMKTQLKAVQ
jgi:phospholipid transport system substrate-binding protein|uniref:ABC transporter substrate-binding protein n=1 Tax=Desulfobacca acetoxidans TaxID=60893 RepID=A0A7V6A3E0_9BACT